MPLIRLTDEDYRHYAQNRPELPLWQSLAWKAYQEALGRKTRLYGLVFNAKIRKYENTKIPDAAALIIIDRTAFGLSTWDIPRGPTGKPEHFAELLSGIIEEAKKERCMAMYVSSEKDFSLQATHSTSSGSSTSYKLQASRRHEHPEATVIIDLAKSDEEILKNMHEKGRYNIRLAQRHGVEIEESKDIDAFYALLQQTGKRDRFGIKPLNHYQKFLGIPGSFLLLAYDGETRNLKNEIRNKSEARNQKSEISDFDIRISDLSPIAGLLGVVWGNTGIYYYGASDHAGRAKMAPSLLQYEAMKFCRSRGTTRYDLFGIAPNDDPAHPWAGVTRFKKQFGGEVVMYPPEQEVTLMPVVKTLMKWKRKMVG